MLVPKNHHCKIVAKHFLGLYFAKKINEARKTFHTKKKMLGMGFVPKPKWVRKIHMFLFFTKKILINEREKNIEQKVTYA